MNARQIGKRHNLGHRDAAPPPHIDLLIGNAEVVADHPFANLVDQRGVFTKRNVVFHAAKLNAAFNGVKCNRSYAQPAYPAHTSRMLETIAERIRRRMADLGTNQTDVAMALGWTQQRFGNYYNGRRMPDLPSIARIAQHLETSVDWLIGVSDSQKEICSAVLLELLAAAGLPPDRCRIVVDALEEAMRLLVAVPGASDDPLRSRMAANVAWHSQSTSKPS